MKAAIPVLGLNQKSVAGLSVRAPVKVLAWWLPRRTTLALQWVSARLGMRRYARATKAISRAERPPGRKLNWIKRNVVRLENQDAELAINVIILGLTPFSAAHSILIQTVFK